LLNGYIAKPIADRTRVSLLFRLARYKIFNVPRATSTRETVNYRKSRAPAINGFKWLIDRASRDSARDARDGSTRSSGQKVTRNTRLPVATIERVIVHRLLSDESQATVSLEATIRHPRSFP